MDLFKSALRIVAVLFFTCSLLQVTPAIAAKHARRGTSQAQRSANPSLVALKDIKVLGGRPAPFALDAHAAILIDARTGAVLYAYNEHERMQPASLAKLMTFYLTLEALHEGRITLATPVAISEKAWRLSMDQSVSRMFLGVGQRVAVRDLLYGLMVSSGNDAAVALAEYTAGSADAFAEQMNAAAKKLGLTETHFTNPDGLPAPDEYTTAADMAKLGRVIVERYPDALTYTSAKEFTFDKIKQRNFNTLLFYDSRVDGLKTGHVEEAGYHLVATAQAHGLRLISAVLGTPSPEKRRTETEKLIDWGLRTFVTVSPDWHKVMAATLPVYEGAPRQVAIAPVHTPYVTVGRGEENKVSLTAMLGSKYLVAPVTKGMAVGVLTLSADSKPQSSIPIQTEAAIGRGGFFRRITDRVRLLF
jgi:D-alanyl-D-alanine carboxypeptidase (penicillin-binding protein 5/6)